MKTDVKIQALVDSYGNWFSQEEASSSPYGGQAKMTGNLYPYDSIFSPIKINRMTIKNRLVMAPMGNIDMCEETGRPNDKMIQYFTERARGGVGLITTGLVPVSHGIDNSITEMGGLSYFPRIDRSRTVLMGWRNLAQSVHNYNAALFIQLTPGLGRVGNPQCLINELKFPVSASLNPNFYIPQIPCVPLSGHKLRKIIKNAGQAAADAKACGIDGVYLHGHEGYLLEQLTNPAFNRRKIGRYRDYQRFGLDLIKELRRRVGPDYPIMYRIDLSLALGETYGEKGMSISALKKFKDGRTPDETLAYMANLVKEGVDLFDVDLGCYDNWWLPHPPAGMPSGCFLEVSTWVKEYFQKNQIRSNAGLEVPVVAVGKLGYPDLAESALRDKKCDMIMLGRPLLADAEWPNKVFAGKLEDIRPCIGCQEGCINEFVDGGHPQCAVNPRTAFEHIYPATPAPTQSPKKIAVIGAGPAGITFAITAAGRGHDVTLFEKNARIGGKLIPGSIPKIKYEVANYLDYLAVQLDKATKDTSLRLLLNTEVSEDNLKSDKYDAIVLANGTRESIPPIAGLSSIPHVLATDLLRDPSIAKDATNIAIVGGGVVGCETAYFLSFEHQKKVTVIEMTPYIMEGVCTANRGHLIHYMEKNEVKLLNCAKVTGATKDGLEILRNVSKGVPNPYNTWQPILPKNIENPLAPKISPLEEKDFVPADLVVLATGGASDQALFYHFQNNKLAPEIHNIGDSRHPGKVHEATRNAYALGLSI